MQEKNMIKLRDINMFFLNDGDLKTITELAY